MAARLPKKLRVKIHQIQNHLSL